MLTNKMVSALLVVLCMAGCDSPRTSSAGPKPIDSINTSGAIQPPQYKAIHYVDSFIEANGEAIKKSTALKEQYEQACTKEMLPAISKGGLYDDLPFELVVTTTHSGQAYGNFVYRDARHFVKVTCIIKKEQLQELQEGSVYSIKFKTANVSEGASFGDGGSSIDLPIINAYLSSFIPRS